MDINTINQKLTSLKAQAAKINAEINSAPNREIKKLKTAEYMELSANIAELKNNKVQLQASARETKEESKKTSIKLANLYFPKEQRVQYFATPLNIVELMLLLKEVFDNEVPSVTSFFSVDANQLNSIPPTWFDLLNEEDENQ